MQAMRRPGHSSYLLLSPVVPCPFPNNSTLQYRRLPSVTTNVAKTACLRLYPKTAKLSNTWAQANWIKANQFSAFLDQRVRRLRRLTSQEIVRSTTHLLAG